MRPISFQSHVSSFVIMSRFEIPNNNYLYYIILVLLFE